MGLRLTLPLIVGVSCLLAASWIYQVVQEQTIERVIVDVSGETRNTVILLQSTIEQYLREDKSASLSQIIAAISAKPDLVSFVVVDSSGNILASMHYADVGREWSEVGIIHDSAFVEKMKVSLSTGIEVRREAGLLDGYGSLCVDAHSGVLRPNDCGFIFYRVDLNYHINRVLYPVEQEVKVVGWGILIGVLLLLTVIDRVVTRRVRGLVGTLQSFSDGNRAVRVSGRGYDELQWLGKEIDHLLDTIVRDEYVLKDREKKLETLFDVVVDAIIIIDANGVMLRVNRATIEMFGYSEDELVGSNVSILMPTEYSERHNDYMSFYQQSGLPKMIGIGREVTALRKGDHRFPVELHVDEMRLDGVVLYVGVMRDVTERKRMETHLRQANKALSEANARLEITATTDALTGIANRRAFDEALRNELNRATREQVSVALLICDVDFFKLYNDHYGHLQGDSCLQQVASVIDGEFQRAGELAARYGGEEFAVILPNCSAEDAQVAAERLRAAVEASGMPHEVSKVSSVVTVSVGYTVYTPSSIAPPDIERFINSADKGLYRAKHVGRNRAAYGQLASTAV